MAKRAFTLAEILITLSILGIVAAIIIPNVTNKISDRQMIAAAKRAHSMFDNALNQMYIVEGQPELWNWANINSTEKKSNFIAEKLNKYLQVSKYCGSSTAAKDDCGKYGYGSGWKLYKSFNGYIGRPSIIHADAERYGKTVLKNNMIYNITYQPLIGNGYGTNYGLIMVDINGRKFPNQMGYDVFVFAYGPSGIMTASPGVYQGNTFSLPFYYRYCKRNQAPTGWDSGFDGFSCYYWIMRHNNMDYKYRDVSKEW